MHGQAVGDFVQLFICIFFLQIHQSGMIGMELYLIAEKIDYCLIPVIGKFRLVEGFDLSDGSFIGNFDFI